MALYLLVLIEHLRSSGTIRKPQHGPVRVVRWSAPFIEPDVERVELPTQQERNGPRSAQEQVHARAVGVDAELTNVRRDRRNKGTSLRGIKCSG
jgi:hypothetical protein